MSATCRKCQRSVETPGRFCPFCGTLMAPATAGEPALVGSTIAGRYFVGQLIGRGAAARVYKGTDLAQDRPVAIKILDQPLRQEPAEAARLEREVGAVARLDHPGCAAVLGFGLTEDQRFYVVMELLAGRTLERLLEEAFPLGQARAIRLTARVLSALGAAHARGLLHRGLTPANVVVETDPEEPDLVRVLDFGLSRPVEPGAARGRAAAAWMSPEQARGEPLDARSDLYAAGVLLFELLTGSLPFAAVDALGRPVEPTASPARRRPDLGIAPDVDAAVAKALSPDPADRFATAEAMREALLICELPPEPVRPREPRPPRRAPSPDAPEAGPSGAPPAPKPAAG